MCLAVPARVVEINGPAAKVEVGGVARDISTMLVPDLKIDDYVLVHTGFAIEKIDQEEAEKTLALFEEMMQE